MLTTFNDDTDLLKKVITGGESWVYGYDIESKSQPSQRKAFCYDLGEKTKIEAEPVCEKMRFKSVSHIIGHYNPSVRITAQLLTTLMLCASILYVSAETYSLTSTPNDRFFEKLFMAGLFTLRVFARNLQR